MERVRELLRRTGWTGSTAILVGVVVAFLVLFLFVPLASMFRLSLWDGQGFTLHYIRNALAASAVRDSLINAAILAVITTATSTLLALPLAYVNVRSEFLGKRWISPLLLVPMILPPFVGAIGMKQLLGPYGVLNAALAHLRLVSPEAHIDWFVEYPLAGIVLLQTLHLYPIIYLNVVASLANVDPSLEDAARNAGASPWTLFRKVTLPLAWPGVFAGAILVFLWAFTDLGTPLMFNYREVVAVRIFDSINESGSADANALVVIVLVIVAVIYYLAKVLVGRKGHEMMARSVQAPPGRRLSFGGTLLAWLLFGTVFVLAALPHAMVVLTSFAGQWQDTILPAVFTATHHREALDHRLTMPSVVNSLIYSLLATGVCVVLAVWVAYVLVRKSFLGRTLLDAAVMLPLAVPGLVLAFGFLNCYHDLGQTLVGWGVWKKNYLYPEANPVLLLVIAYAVRRLPYMIRSSVAGFEQTSRTLEEAALNVGATPLRTVVRITVPLILANIIAGCILVFTFSMLEVSDSLILAKDKAFYPLTKAIYTIFNDDYSMSADAVACALGVWAMVLLAVSLVVSTGLLGRKMGAIFRA
jgi:iron(III) transport system permease protein